jgi:hypothetical protein
MSTFFRAIAFSLILLGLTTISFAQDKGKKDENFLKIAKLANSKKPEDQDKAYAIAKDFITAFGKDNDDKVKKVNEFVSGYEFNRLNNYIDTGKFDDAFLLGKEMLEKNPEEVYVLINLVYAGYNALTKNKDDSFGGDSINYAKQAISLVEKGKLPKTFTPFKNQNDATAWMYVIIGTFSQDFDPKETVTNYYNALKIDSEVKAQAQLYVSIANYYEKQYEQASKDFQVKNGLKTKEDAEMKADNAKIDAILDRLIDSYARVVKIAEAEKNPNMASFKTRLTQIYKFRKQTDAGLNELLNTVLSTPMPMPN